jgi:ubiquinone/menaquinone biosynthesis C-methylase UbiE
MVSSPFTGSTVAARYARSRPALHHHVVEILGQRLPLAHRALDLACGTGLSTRPLLSIASIVVGVDIDAEMLKVAGRTDGISYVLGAGEHLPFDTGTFDLVTVCSGIHWLQPPALEEVHRVLASARELCVYDVWFPAEMVDVPAFSMWVSERCAPRYPSIAKNAYESDQLREADFEPTWSEDLSYEVPMVLERLVDYLMTHSERIAAIRAGLETEEEQHDFLSEGLRPLFESSAERRLMFGIRAETYRRLES